MSADGGMGGDFVVIGAGPAGLTAGYELVKLGFRPIVIEQQNLVGGLASTAQYRGYYFDMGGHRFFTKVQEVKKMWQEVLRENFLCRPRLSRIYYNGKFFYYPLRPFNALKGLGLWEGLLVLLSYLKWQLLPHRREDTFEQWVTNRFGKRLFQIFFKAYTEKVWGISCSELKAEWAAQRIKDLSLRTALMSMFLRPRTTIKTLIEEFDYPRYGPGMMWNAVKSEIERGAGTVLTEAEVVRVNRTGRRIDSVVVRHQGREETINGTSFISSMPVTDFVRRLDRSPAAVVDAAVRLRYRDFLTVVCIVNKPELFPDNWIYVHDPKVQVGRIQNFKNWSPDMVPDSTKTSLGLEYFCTEGDALWTTSDEDLLQLAKCELERIGLCRAAEVEDGCVVRVPKAYPVYGSDYREALAVVREFVDSLENFRTIGRNGLHRYNNQDHAMLTGMLAVRSMVLGEPHDLWSINTEQDYHEEVRTTASKPFSDLDAVVEEELARVFLRIDRVALGLSVGVLGGLGLFAATLLLLLAGGPVIGPTLGLLGNYFPGYSVTWSGSLLGLFYGFLSGFIGGWLFAGLRNLVIFLYLVAVYRRWRLRRMLDCF
ncbi:MAG TPA: NAD(P)-binding protein [Verrucomicrobiae bacterium]|nr:NAD(P)-binding protein [Verrucomicrobiae bacterium]